MNDKQIQCDAKEFLEARNIGLSGDENILEMVLDIASIERYLTKEDKAIVLQAAYHLFMDTFFYEKAEKCSAIFSMYFDEFQNDTQYIKMYLELMESTWCYEEEHSYLQKLLLVPEHRELALQWYAQALVLIYDGFISQGEYDRYMIELKERYGKDVGI